MDLTKNQPIEESDEVVSGGEETNIASSVGIDGEHKEKVTEEKLPDAEPVEEAAGDSQTKRQGGGAEAGSTSVLTPNASRSCDDVDDESDDCSAMRKRKTASASVTLSYEVVEEEEQIEPAMKKLRELGEGLPLLAVDLEGENLSRKGRLSIISVATENCTFLFDIQKLGAGVFDKGLKDLLEDPDRQKLMFDCRQDSDCLWHQLNVKLNNVLDLQLMEVIHRGEASAHQLINLRASDQVIDVPRVLSFQTCLENYVKDEDLIKAKKEVHHFHGVWSARPLGKSSLQYAAADVIGMLRLYRVLWDKFEKMNAMEQLRDVSNRYLDFYRLKGNRSYDMYEGNPFLPWRIFQSTYDKKVVCVGCDRYFPSADFSNTQKRLGVQKCPVCKKVKNVEDVRENREDNWSRRDYYRDLYRDNYDYVDYYDSDCVVYGSDYDSDNDCCIM